MGLVRRAAFVAMSVAACAAGVSASVASCTFGDYDGSFDSAGLEVLTTADAADGAPAAPPLVTQVPPGMQKAITTTDGVLTVTVPAGAYASQVTITITRLADRAVKNSFVVPVYSVAVSPDGPSAAPVQLVFKGNANNTNGAPGALLMGVVDGDQTKRLPVEGANPQLGNESPIWGLTKNLTATYSLAFFEDIGPSGSIQNLLEPSHADCLLNCCNISGTGGPASGQLFASDVGCVCEQTSDKLDCFLQCDITASAQRCLDLKNVASGPLGCAGGGAGCMAGPSSSVCCYQPPSGISCNGPNGNGCKYVEICTSDSNCQAPGEHCCAYDDESLCSKNCPPERRTCTVTDGGAAPECDGGACKNGGPCGIHTCGATLADCQ